MTAIIAGSGAGLFDSTLTQVNGSGSTGTPKIGSQGTESSYVNVATGNLVLQGQDEFVASLGVDNSLTRTYNSLGGFDGDNGDGWRIGVYRSLAIASDQSIITRTSGDGHQATFTSVSLGFWRSDDGDGAADTIRQSGNNYIYTEGGTGTTEIYDSSGRLLSAADADGNTKTYGYTGSLITSVTDASGQVTYLDYAGNNLSDIRVVGLKPGATSVTDTQSQIRVRYGYDDSNRLTSVTVDLSPEDGCISDGNVFTTTYGYDGSSDRVSSVDQSDGSSLRVFYQQVGDKYLVSIVYSNGQYYYLNYDVANNKTSVTSYVTSTTYSFDANNRIIGVDASDLPYPDLNYRYSYDANGNVTQSIDGDGRVIHYRYDADDNLIFTQDSLGNTVTRTYDENDKLLTETSYTQPASNGADSTPVSGGLTSRYVYDARQNLRFSITPAGRVTEYRYNSVGERISSIEYTAAFYTASGSAESDLAGWVSNIDKSQSQRTDSNYDLSGQIKSATTYTAIDSNGNGVMDGTQSVRRYVYDIHGRLLISADPRTTSTTAGRPLVTSYLYDGLDRQILAQDATGRIASTIYNDTNQNIVVTGTGGVITTTIYNDAGQAITVSKSTSDGKSLGTITNTYLYDRLVRTTDETGKVTKYVYNDAGRLIYTIDPLNYITETKYDAAGNMIGTVQYANSFDNSNLVLSPNGRAGFGYNGNIKSVSSENTNLQNAPTALLLYSTTALAFGAEESFNYPATGGDTFNFSVAVQRGSTKKDGTYGSFQLGATFYVSNSSGGTDPVILYAGSVDGSTADAQAINAELTAPPGTVYFVPFVTTDHTDPTYQNEFSIDKGGSWYFQNLDISPSNKPAPTILDNALYDSLNTAAHIIDSTEDRTTANYYDAAGQLVYTVDSAGFVTQNTYDGAGRKTSQTKYATALTTVPTTGRSEDLSVISSPDDRTTRYFYDDDGLLIGTLDAAGFLSQTKYDAAGEVTETIAYAIATNPSIRSSGSFADLLASTPGDIFNVRHSYFLYDAKGQMTARLDAGTYYLMYGQDVAYLTEYGYDTAGNQTSETKYTNAISHVTGESLKDLRTAAASPYGQDQLTTHQYDALNRVSSEVDYQGTVTDYAYDSVTGYLNSSTRAYGQFDAQGNSEARTTSYFYDALGRVTATLNGEGSAAYAAAAGNTSAAAAVVANYGIKSVYDLAGRKTQSTDANGSTTLFYYDDDGRLTYTINAAGEVAQTVYDAFDDQKETVRYSQRIDTTVLAGGLVSADGLLNNRLSGLTLDTNARINSFTYDNKGELSQQTDALGYSVSQTYDAFGDVKTRLTDVQLSIDSGISQRLDTFDYDARGLQTQAIIDVGGSALKTTTNYTAYGQVSAVFGAAGDVESFSYDERGNVISTYKYGVDSAGTYVGGAFGYYEYDAFDRLLISQNYGYSRNHNENIFYSYDDQDQSLSVSIQGYNAASQSVTVSNRFGQTIAATDGDGNTQKYDYDRDGNLRFSINALGIQTEQQFDTADRLKASIDGRGIQTTYTYDSANRVSTRTVDPSGLNLQTAYTYDAFGEATQVKDANNVTTETVFDKDGRTAAVIVDSVQSTAPGAFPALKIATLYRYDTGNNVIELQEGVQATGSAGNWTYGPALKTTAFRYDDAGHQVATIVDPDNLRLTTSYAYDAGGNVIRKTDEAGNIWRYAYDPENRQRYAVDPSGAITENQYDLEGKITDVLSYATTINSAALTDQSTLEDFSNTITKNVDDRHTRSVYDGLGRLAYAIDGLGDVTGYTYDRDSRLINTVVFSTPIDASSLPDATEASDIQSLVGAGNPAIDEITHNTYNVAGQLTDVTDALGHTEHYGYDLSGNRNLLINKAGQQWDYVFDSANRLMTETAPPVSIEIYDSNRNPTNTFETARIVTHFEYDGVGNLTAKIEAAGRPEQRRTEFVYDAAGRQIQINYPLTAIYNNTAERADVSLSDVEITPSALFSHTYYNALGQAILYRDVGGGVSAKGYDTAGRLTTEIDAALNVTTYGYDSRGNQTRVTRYANPITVDATIVAAAGSGDILGIQAEAILLANSSAVTGGDSRTITTNYNVVGQKYQVIQSAAYTYDSSVPIALRDSSASAQTQFIYNAFGELIQQSVLRNANTNDWINTYSYYDLSGHQTAQVSEVETTTNGVAARSAYLTTSNYDALGRLVHQVQYSQPLAVGTYNSNTYPALTPDTYSTTPTSLNTAALRHDREVVFGYDLLNRQTTSTQVGVGYFDPVTNQQINGNLTDITSYDALGNIASTITGSTDGVSGPTTYHYYDALGRQTGVAAPTRTTVRIGDQPAFTSTPYIRYEYDALGNQVKQTAYANGLANASHDPLATGGQLPVVSSSDHVTMYQYDSLGHQTMVTDAFGNQSVSVYDAYGHVRKTWTNDVSSNKEINAVGITLYEYDAIGHLTATQRVFTEVGARYLDNEDYVTYYLVEDGTSTQQSHYNAYGEIDESGTRELAGTAGLGNGYQYYYEYDAAGRIWRTNDKDGVARIYTYDLAGNVTLELRSASVDLKSAAYTLSGLQAVADGSDASLRRTENTYDSAGRLTQQTQPQYTDVRSGVTLLPVTAQVYDRWGNVIRRYDAYDGLAASLQTYTDYVYDGRNQLVEQIAPLVNDVGSDGLTTVIHPTDYFGYDTQGHQVAHADANAVQTAVASGSAPALTTRRYDEAGQLVDQEQPDGSGTLYAYDNFGNMTVESKRIVGGFASTYYYYDLLNRQGESVGPAGAVTYSSYNAAGQKIEEHQLLSRAPNNGIFTISEDRYTYDSQGRLIDQVLGAQVQSYNTVYNTGQPSRLSYGDPNTYTAVSSDPGIHKSFGYDVLDHKTYEGNDTLHADTNGTLTKDSQTWTYDAYGRVQTEIDLSGDFIHSIYDDAGALVQVIHYDGDVEVNGATPPNNGPTDPSAIPSKAAILGNRIKETITYQYANNGSLDTQTDATRVASGTAAGTGGYDGSTVLIRQALYSYNVRAERTSVIERDGSDASTLVTQRKQMFTYDALGREIQQTDGVDTTLYDGSSLAGWTQQIYNGQGGYDNGHWEVNSGYGNPAPAFYGYSVRSDADLLYRSVGLGEAASFGLSFDTAITLNQTNSQAQYYFLSNQRSGPSIYVDFNGNIVYNDGQGHTQSYGGFPNNTAAHFAISGTQNSDGSFAVIVKITRVDNPNTVIASFLATAHGQGDQIGFASLNSNGQQDAHAVYVDNIIVTGSGQQQSTITTSYDAAGNRRNVVSSYTQSDGTPNTESDWYTYDAVNRVLIDGGSLLNDKVGYTDGHSDPGSIVIQDGKGTQYAYDVAGNRSSATTRVSQNLTDGDQDGSIPTQTDYDLIIETYEYDGSDRLHSTIKTYTTYVPGTPEQTGYDDNGQPYTIVAGTQDSYQPHSEITTRIYDQGSRVIEVDQSEDGTISSSTHYAYFADGRNLSQSVDDGKGTYQYAVSYSNAGDYDAAGNLVHYQVNQSGQNYVTNYNFVYQRIGDSYKQIVEASTNPYGANRTVSQYDVAGNLVNTIQQTSSNSHSYYVVQPWSDRDTLYYLDSGSIITTYIGDPSDGLAIYSFNLSSLTELPSDLLQQQPNLTVTRQPYKATYTTETNGDGNPGNVNIGYQSPPAYVEPNWVNTNNDTRYRLNTAGQIETKSATDGRTNKTYYYDAYGHLVGNSGKDNNVESADFDPVVSPLSDQYPALTPSHYVVQSGDTLQSIAQQVYGDSRLWYLIADANGLKADNPQPGVSLVIPTAINNANRADTFKPYNPNELIGDLTPAAAPPPPPNQHSSSFALILIAAIVIAATVATFQYEAVPGEVSGISAAAAEGAAAGTATGAVSTAAAGTTLATSVGGSVAAATGYATAGEIAGYATAGAIAGAVGGLTGQALYNIAGYQRGFNLAQFGASVIGGAVGGAFGGPLVNGGLSSIGAAALGDAATQGVNIAFRQQNGFSWSELAATAVTAGIFGSTGNSKQDAYRINFGSGIAADALRSAASGVTNQSVRVLLDGQGKVNLVSIAADAFGNALGNSIVGALKTDPGQAQRAAQLQQDVANEESTFINGHPVPTGAAGVGYTPDYSAPVSSDDSPVATQSPKPGYQYYIADGVPTLLGSSETGYSPTPQRTDGLGNFLPAQPGDDFTGISINSIDSPSVTNGTTTEYTYLSYFEQRIAALHGAESELNHTLYHLPELIRTGIQDHLYEYGQQSKAYGQNGNGFQRALGITGFYAAGVGYAVTEVAVPFDTFGGGAAGVAGGAVLGRIAEIPAVNAALNTNLTPYASRAFQAAADYLEPIQQSVGDLLLDETGSLTFTNTVPRSIRLALSENGYLDPRTNTFKAATLSDPISVDHIYPTSRIQQLDGFEDLTRSQQLDILQDNVGLGNFQPLPQSLNSSKGNLLKFETFRGAPIDPTYAANLIRLQQSLEVKIQRQINTFLKLNAGSGQ